MIRMQGNREHVDDRGAEAKNNSGRITNHNRLTVLCAEEPMRHEVFETRFIYYGSKLSSQIS